MATPVDTLLVRIESDMADLKNDLAKLQGQTKRVGDSFRNMGKIIAAALTGVAAGKIINTIRTFEDLQATLKAVTGSADLAADSFQLITKFTASTTFQLDEVTGAFITLKNAGIAPTSDVLKDVGNLAAATGKDIRDVAQAIFNATTGEMEMLKQFGIVAKLEGENVRVTYNGVTETISRSSESIVEYLRGISQENFSTAIEERANTLSGALSNLEDNFSLFIMTMGDAGLKQAMTELVQNLIKLVEKMKPLAILVGKTLALAFNALTAAISFVIDHMRTLVIVATAFISVQLASAAYSAAKGYIAMAKAVKAAGAAMAVMNKLSKTNVIGLGLAGALVVADEAGLLEDVLNQLSGVFGDFFAVADDGGKSIEELDAAMAALGVTATAAQPTAMTKSLEQMNEQLQIAKMRLAGWSEEKAKAAAGAGISLGGNNDSTIIFPEGTAEGFDMMNGKMETLKNLKEQVRLLDLGIQFAEEKDAAAQLTDVMNGLTLAYQTGNISLDTYKAKMAEVKSEMAMLNPVTKGLFDTMQSASNRAADAIADAFVNMEFNMRAFQDIAKQIIGDIIAMFIKLAITNRIMNSLFGLTGAAALPTLASGGTIQRDQPTIVGERGPELFIPSSAGTIANGANTRSMLGGGSPTVVQQNISIETGVAQTVRAEIASLMPTIKADTVKAVAEARRRGGSFAQAFGG